MSLPQRLDDLAYLTRIPQMSARLAMDKRRRHLRWTPLLALLIVVGGMAWMLASPERSWLGYIVLLFGNMIAIWMPLFGPVKQWGALEPIDEREAQVRRNAYFATYMAISIVAVLGLFLLTGLALLHGWKIGTLIFDLAAFAFFLISLWEIIPTLHASWTTRPIEDE